MSECPLNDERRVIMRELTMYYYAHDDHWVIFEHGVKIGEYESAELGYVLALMPELSVNITIIKG